MKLSVVIPVFNERATIREIFRAVSAVDVEKEIVIVDDFSTDGTREVLPELAAAGARVLLHDRNRGKGAALRTGFAAASGDLVVVQDADLEYDPREYPKLLEPILAGDADAVFGSRFLGGPHRVMLYWHYVGNRFLTTVSNMLSNLNLTDMETCYKVFKSEVLRNMRLRSNRFGIEPELTAKVARGRWRVYEVGISYSGRSYEEGKKITWKDGAKAVWCIVRFAIAD